MPSKLVIFFRALAGSLVMLVSGLALFGWIYDRDTLTGSSPHAMPLLPLVATSLFLLGFCHLIAVRFPVLTRIVALLAGVVILIELGVRTDTLPVWLRQIFTNAFSVDGYTQRISINGLIGVSALTLGHLIACFFRRNARAQTIVTALSLITIGVGILALYGHVTGLPNAFQWGNSIALSANAAGLMLLLGLSKATTAWARMLSLINDFESIVSELRLVVLTLFLALVSMASGIALIAVREAQVNARSDMLVLFAGNSYQRLSSYMSELTQLADSIRKAAPPTSKSTLKNSNLIFTNKNFAPEISRLGILDAEYSEVSSKYAILRSEVDALKSSEILTQLRLVDGNLFFVRSVSNDDTSLQLGLDLQNFVKVLSGFDTQGFTDLELALTPAGSDRTLLVHIKSPSLAVAGELPVSIATKQSDEQRVKEGAFSINVTHKLEAPAVSLSVRQLDQVPIFSSRSGFFSMISILLLLSALGSTVLMHLVTALGTRSTILGAQLSETVTQLKKEIAQREEDSKTILKAGKEKEILLREVHHRVNNNLQIVSSIFSLQLRRADNEVVKHLLKEATSRLQAISLLHRTLYKSKNLSEIAVTDYLKEVVHHTLNNFDAEQRIKVDITSDHQPLEVERAISLGLIITELIINSAKHAWPSSSGHSNPCSICLDLRQIDQARARLDYSDDGVGLPADFDISGAKSLGMKLVSILTKQLHGELTIRQGLTKGVSYTITFPLKFEEELNGTGTHTNS